MSPTGWGGGFWGGWDRGSGQGGAQAAHDESHEPVGCRRVLNKADNINASELAAALAKVEAEAKKHPAAYPVIHVTSAEKKMGIDELRAAVLADVRI